MFPFSVFRASEVELISVKLGLHSWPIGMFYASLKARLMYGIFGGICHLFSALRNHLIGSILNISHPMYQQAQKFCCKMLYLVPLHTKQYWNVGFKPHLGIAFWPIGFLAQVRHWNLQCAWQVMAAAHPTNYNQPHRRKVVPRYIWLSMRFRVGGMFR